MALSDGFWYTDDEDVSPTYSSQETNVTKQITTTIQPPAPPPAPPPVQPPQGVVVVSQNPQYPIVVQTQTTAYKMGDKDQIPATLVQTTPKRKRVYYWPFIIYLILSAIVLLGFIFSKRGMGETLTYVLLQIIWIIIIGFIIYWLCKSGKVGWAWFVLFLPLIIQIVWVVFAAIFPSN